MPEDELGGPPQKSVEDKDFYGKDLSSDPPGLPLITSEQAPDFAQRKMQIIATPENAPLMPGEVSWKKLRELRIQHGNRLHEKYGDTMDFNEIELALDLYFGPAGLRDDNLRVYESKPTQLDKRSFASLMALQMHAAYSAARTDLPDNYVDSVHDAIVILRNIAYSELGRLKGVGKYYQGLRSGTAVLKAFEGWDKILPNYSQDVDSLPENWQDLDEVLGWDVESGVDFFVQDKEGNIVLIDSKGQLAERRSKEGEDPADLRSRPIFEISIEDDWENSLPETLVNALKSRSPKKVFRSTIVVPTDDIHYRDFNFSDKENYNKRREISKFGRFADPQMRSVITGEIERYIQEHS